MAKIGSIGAESGGRDPSLCHEGRLRWPSRESPRRQGVPRDAARTGCVTRTVTSNDHRLTGI